MNGPTCLTLHVFFRVSLNTSLQRKNPHFLGFVRTGVTPNYCKVFVCDMTNLIFAPTGRDG